MEERARGELEVERCWTGEGDLERLCLSFLGVSEADRSFLSSASERFSDGERDRLGLLATGESDLDRDRLFLSSFELDLSLECDL